MDTSIAILQQKVATLAGMVEGLLARHPSALPPPPQIVQVNQSGQILDWNGSAYVADGSLSLSLRSPAGNWGIFRPQSQHWELLAANQSPSIAVLLEDLDYGTTVGALAQLYGGRPGHEAPLGTATVFDWKLEPGDTIPSGTAVDLNVVNGFQYVRNAGCGLFYYLPPGSPCECGPCITGCAPPCVTLTVSGMAGEYAPFNGVWVCPLNSGSTEGQCAYDLLGFAEICGVSVNLVITLLAGGTVTVDFSAPGQSNVYFGTFTADDCGTLSLSWSGYAGSYTPASGGPGSPHGGGICLDGGNSGEDSGALITLTAGGC